MKNSDVMRMATRYCLRRGKITQRAFSERLGLARQSLTSYVNGSFDVSSDVQTTICRVFHIHPWAMSPALPLSYAPLAAGGSSSQPREVPVICIFQDKDFNELRRVTFDVSSTREAYECAYQRLGRSSDDTVSAEFWYDGYFLGGLIYE